MNSHSEVISQLKNSLINKGTVLEDPIIEVAFNLKNYKPDLLFENLNSHTKVIIEVKKNMNNANISYGTISFLVDFKNFLDNNTDYKFVVIFTNELSPNMSKLIYGRVTYYSLKENSIEEIADIIHKMTI